MVTVNPVDNTDKLTSAELGKLWTTYMGNTMAKCVLRYYLQHVEDQDIRTVLQEALDLSEQFVQTIHGIYTRERHPIPIGFNDDDVNLGAPRLFEDELYLHYLKYTGKAGMSVYQIAVPLMVRPDVRTFFTNCLESTIKLMNHVNDVLINKGFLVKSPYIPQPENVDFIKKQHFLDGFFGDIRPLQALEITHLYDNVQNNVISKAICLGFSQVSKSNQVRNFLIRGKELTNKHFDVFTEKLQKDDLPSHPLLDHLVTNSTDAPFSDKLMMFHKVDMFSLRIRTYGNSLSFCSRHDITAMLGKAILELGNYVEDGANIMIEHGWMEQPPLAADRNALARK